VLSLLQSLHHAGRTIVLITHDHAIAAQAQRAVEFHDGRILTDDARSGVGTAS
jgi:ABC-type lipoprotein export system ATPase subunit